MSTLEFLHQLIGAQALGDHLTAAVNELIHRERIAPSDAYRRITAQADAGDPAVIAATRQTWVRRTDVDPTEAPVRRLFILERTERGVFVIYLDIDADADDGPQEGDLLRPEHRPLNDHSQGAELAVDLLNLYELEAWDPFESLLPTVGGIHNLRPVEVTTP